VKTCAVCGKRKKETSFRKDGRYKDNLSRSARAAAATSRTATRPPLTRILAGVDERDRIAARARLRGAADRRHRRRPDPRRRRPVLRTGSPPEGDFFTKADLEQIAEQTNKLEQAASSPPPSKLGHSEEQRLLNNSGLPVGDELPAAGWLTNFRVEKIGGVWKLLADVKQVPAKLGQILASGGYRTRSVELSRVTSQVSGETYDGVVTGLAWLGAKAPAVRTLDDIWNLYGPRPRDRRRRLGGRGRDHGSPLRPHRGDQPGDRARRAVVHVGAVGQRRQPEAEQVHGVSDWDSDTTWIIGFTVGADNEPTVDARDKWVPSTMKLVEIDPADADTLGGGWKADRWTTRATRVQRAATYARSARGARKFRRASRRY
jgi:hypothetical protein